MQQLSSRDCDKWLSMTLTMKERFSLCTAKEEREMVEKRETEEKREEGKQLESCVGSVASRV